MSRKSIQSLSEDRAKLREYLSAQAEGTELSFLRIEADTGVVMDRRGRAIVSRELKLKHTLRGYGVRIPSKDDAMGTVDHRRDQVRRAVRRMGKTLDLVGDKFGPRLEGADLQRYNVARGFMGAIASMVKGDKLLKS